MRNRYDPMANMSIAKRINDYRHFLESKPQEMYPGSVIKEINKLSVDPVNFPPRIFGSYAFRIQAYPGDVDLFEYYLDCCSPEAVAKKFIPKFQKVVEHILNNRAHYYSETKAGLDTRYVTPLGQMINGDYRPDDNLFNVIIILHNQKLLDNKEFNIMKTFLRQGNQLNGDEYDAIEKILRDHYILRWSAKEILQKNPKKILPGGVIKTLQDACLDPTLLKIDEITFLDGNVNEITNVFRLGYYTKEQKGIMKDDIKGVREQSFKEPLAVIFNYQETGLTDEIEKLYYSNMYYNPFKMIKRLFSFLKKPPPQVGTAAQKFLKHIIGFVSSNTSKMYQIKSELDTAKIVIEERQIAKVSFFKQLDIIINKIANTIDIPQPAALEMIKIIKQMQNTTGRTFWQTSIDKIISILEVYINYNTITFLKERGYNPLPAFVLPQTPKYDRRIIRTPYDHKYNILSNFDANGKLKPGKFVSDTLERLPPFSAPPSRPPSIRPSPMPSPKKGEMNILPIDFNPEDFGLDPRLWEDALADEIAEELLAEMEEPLEVAYVDPILDILEQRLESMQKVISSFEFEAQYDPELDEITRGFKDIQHHIKNIKLMDIDPEERLIRLEGVLKQLEAIDARLFAYEEMDLVPEYQPVLRPIRDIESMHPDFGTSKKYDYNQQYISDKKLELAKINKDITKLLHKKRTPANGKKLFSLENRKLELEEIVGSGLRRRRRRKGGCKFCGGVSGGCKFCGGHNQHH